MAKVLIVGGSLTKLCSNGPKTLKDGLLHWFQDLVPGVDINATICFPSELTDSQGPCTSSEEGPGFTEVARISGLGTRDPPQKLRESCPSSVLADKPYGKSQKVGTSCSSNPRS